MKDTDHPDTNDDDNRECRVNDKPRSTTTLHLGLILFLGLLLVSSVALEGHHGYASQRPKATVRVSKARRNRQEVAADSKLEARQRALAGGGNFDNLGSNLGKVDIDMDENFLTASAAIIGAAILVPIGLIASAIPAIGAAGCFLHLVDEHTHVIPSVIRYTIPSTVTVRDPSWDEIKALINITDIFYSGFLEAKHAGNFSSFTILYDDVEQNSGSFLSDIWDSITGQQTYYGYELEFVAVVKVADTDNLPLGQVLATMHSLDMTTYVSNYLSTLTYNIFSSTETALYIDQL